MDFLQELREDRKEKVIVYDRFMKLYPKNPTRIYCFYEGKMDDKYYGLRIDKYFEQEKEHLCCEGKSNVLYMRKMLREIDIYKDCKGLFFIDRDFDEPVEDEEVFETPCYSIENLFVQRYTVEQIIKREFFISEDDSNFETICNMYTEALSKFHEVVKVLNAWIYFQRKQEKIHQKKKKLHLEILSEKKLYVLTLNKKNTIVDIEKKYHLEDIERMFSTAYPISEEEMCEHIKMVEKMQPELDYRGKQEFDFLCCFIEKVKEELSLCKKKKQNRGLLIYNSDMKKISLDLSAKGDIHISKLTNYAVMPQELDAYLKRMAQQYV
ncbi:MAG: DUF4435 domain-containing protein [Lachnospiraceae bacterium]|nr:DUF4435 domain-containing protein [Lachnospiraceae bacterium]